MYEMTRFFLNLKWIILHVSDDDLGVGKMASPVVGVAVGMTTNICTVNFILSSSLRIINIHNIIMS